MVEFFMPTCPLGSTQVSDDECEVCTYGHVLACIL